jgi:hypothetical protein
MVLGQHASSKLQHLFLQHKSIRVPSKITVCDGKIAHGGACNPKRVTINPCKSSHPINLTYVRMVLGQHASLKLQHLFPQHKSIREPSKSMERAGKVVHSSACNPKRVTINPCRSLHPINLTYVRMVLGQHASSKLQHLFLQHKSIRVPSKITIRGGKTTHGGACNPKRVTINKCEASHPINLTYVRMVLGQHASLKLQHLFPQHKSIRVPSKITVRGGKIAHGGACNPKRVTINPCEASHPINLTYGRMVLGQHASLKLQHLFLQYKSIREPSKI